MPTISDIFNHPTPTQRMLGTDLAMLGGFARERIILGQFDENARGPLKFMGGAGHKAKQAGRFAQAGKWGLAARSGSIAAGRAVLPVAGLYFAASAAVRGFKDGGVTGAATGIAGEVALTAALSLGGRALFTPVGAAAGAAAAGVSALGYGIYRGAEASWQYHMKSLPLETAGSTAAFQTGGAATMRQRSMMNIQRSHLNARSAFGNEAQWAHIARYRGVGRRGTM